MNFCSEIEGAHQYKGDEIEPQRQYKTEEYIVISFADTVINPVTMVVKLMYTPIASVAVSGIHSVVCLTVGAEVARVLHFY